MRYSISIDIDALPDRVWAIMIDIERWPEWTPSVRKIHRLEGGPLASGSAARIYQPKFPPTVWTVTELEPGRSFSWVAVSPGARVVAKHEITSVDKRSRVTLSLDYSGFLGVIIARLTRRIIYRYLNYEVSGLKRRSEESVGKLGDQR